MAGIPAADPPAVGDDGPGLPAVPIGLPAVPAGPAIAGLQIVTLGQHTIHQGRDTTFELSGCGPTSGARVVNGGLDGAEHRLIDLDQDPDTFTLGTSDLPVSSYQVSFDCASGVRAAGDLFIYRQTGAARGGAESIVLATGIGLLSAATIRGIPALLVVESALRRRRI